MPSPANPLFGRGSFSITRGLIGTLIASAMAFAVAPADAEADGFGETTAIDGTSTPTTSQPETPPVRTVANPVVAAATPTTNTPTSPSTEQPETPQLEPVTLAFGGDIHFEGFLETMLAQDPTGILAPVAAMMADADLAIANLETAVTERGQPSNKAFNFRTSPAAFTALRSSGIDVVSVANNHGMDYGLEGLEDTISHARNAEFPLIGAGADASEAYAPWSVEIKGHRIAVIGATQVLDGALRELWTATDSKPGLASAKERERLYAEVKKAAGSHDVVVVFLHWGIEGDTCPAQRQIDLADGLVAAGAKIIVGGHAHRVQGGGFHNGAFVHYGLGNFVFYRRDAPSTESGVLRVTVLGDSITDYEWVPAVLVDGVATRNDEPEAGSAWEQLRSCTNLTKGPQQRYNSYAEPEPPLGG